MGMSEHDLRNTCKGATVLPGISITGAESALNQAQVADWARNSLKGV